MEGANQDPPLAWATDGLQSKLLGKGAKNPYAAYSSSCEQCKTKTEQGRKLCQRCAYKANGMRCPFLAGLKRSPSVYHDGC